MENYFSGSVWRYWSSLKQVWHKATSMVQSMTTEFTNNKFFSACFPIYYKSTHRNVKSIVFVIIMKNRIVRLSCNFGQMYLSLLNIISVIIIMLLWYNVEREREIIWANFFSRAIQKVGMVKSCFIYCLSWQ